MTKQEYVKERLELLQKDPSSLEKMEITLLEKFQRERAAALKALHDIKQLETQVNQAQATIRSLELQFTSHEGRASAFVDLLVPEELQDEEASGNGQAGEIKTVVSEERPAKQAV